MTTIGINGFGRIGRCILRNWLERQGTEQLDLKIVAVNDLSDPATLLHLLRYDSAHGPLNRPSVETPTGFDADGHSIRVLADRDPALLNWSELGVDIVLECTGLFTDANRARAHLDAGARKVIIGAPAENHDHTIVMGVNDATYDADRHQIISNASCTTNCLAPLARVMLDEFGIESGLMTTVHAYTNDQSLLDVPHQAGNLRRSRAAATSIVPTTTGAARAVSQVIPELAGKLDGVAFRVPVLDVSLVNLTLQTVKSVSRDAIHEAMRAAASHGELAPYLEYTEEELVSCDFISHPASSIFDATQTVVLGDRFCKISAWYDNEWGFANRMLDLAQLISSRA